MTQRRRYRTDGRRIVDISDESLDGTAVEGASVSDFLLEELERRREGRMKDIVATIQSDQYRLITAEPDGALVVQGGPGTGKTAVGLHRASWLLYTHREQLRRVLVVGPNPTFMEYVSHVLPALGEEAVEQRAVSELLDGIVVEREDAADVARLKADTRLAEVVTRAVERSVQTMPRELVLYVDGEFVRVREREVAELLAEVLEDDSVPVAVARERFRMAVLRRFYERYGEKLGERALRSFDELERALKNKGFLAKWLDTVFAVPRADKLVARLLTSPAALREAADGVLDAAEQKLLLRDRPKRAADLQWSDHDLPLLDVARTLVDGPPRGYGHVIVDEAQDLSPMQLLMISRRAADGSLTMLGDVAQATGPVVYGQWAEVGAYLPEMPLTIEELRHAYRVPAEIMELALPLLDLIAPDLERPLAYRRGGEPPMLIEVAAEDLLATAMREVAELEGLVAVIAPRSLVDAAPPGDAFDEISVPVLTPRRSKGLEFDGVVVVEPALIAEEGGDGGLRELYVALTRPTKSLVVVHSRPLPYRNRYLSRS